MPQNDEPPRDFAQIDGVPNVWKEQSQGRIYYLRGKNDQYLQFYDGKVTGTMEEKPPFGIVRFLSHKEHLVIRSFMDNKYLCMNEDSVIYLSNKEDDPECFMQESYLQNNGTHATTYHFTKYKTGVRRYLGINCDPLLGTKANPNMKSSQFTTMEITEAEVRTLKKDIERNGAEKYVKRRCVSPADKKRAAQAKRRKLRLRWCLNIDRMIHKRVRYVQQCLAREKHNCDKKGQDGDSKRCVCDILRNMLSKPKRARRKCLVERLTKWVEKKNSTTNAKAVIEASKLLVRNYAAISRRFRLLRARKHRQKQREFDKAQKERTSIKDTPLQTVIEPASRIPTPNSAKINHRMNEESIKKKRRKRRRNIIKLKSILNRYGHELILTSPSIHRNEQAITTERTNLLSDVTQISIPGKTNEPSVLSNEFKHVLNSLSTERQHRRRRRKHRHRKPRMVSEIMGNVHARKSGDVSAG